MMKWHSAGAPAHVIAPSVSPPPARDSLVGLLRRADPDLVDAATEVISYLCGRGAYTLQTYEDFMPHTITIRQFVKCVCRSIIDQ